MMRDWPKAARKSRALVRGLVAGNASRLRVEPLEQREMFAVLTWSPGINLPSPRAGAAVLETPGQSILVVGGGTTTVNQLSPGANGWSTASAIDLNRVSPGFGSTGSQYLVYGGTGGGATLDAALTYDPYVLDNVQDAANMHSPRTKLAYATDTTHPYAIGGLGQGNSVLSSVERYDVASDSWTTVAPLPQARFSFAAVDDGAGHIFTFGGATSNNNTSVSNTVYCYTVATNTWTSVAPMLTATRDSAAVLASNGRIYVLGGLSAAGTLATVQSYDPATNTWRSETDLPAPVSAAAAVSDSLGRIEVIGGYDQGHTPLATVVVSQRLNMPDSPPSFTSTPPASVITGSTYSYQATASGNPQPTFALVTAPSGMTIDSGTGQIAWAPSLAQAGLNNVTIRATNVAGSIDQSFSVRVYTPAPTIPTGLTVSGVTTNTVSLAWLPSTDLVGVVGYRVYRVTHTGWHGTVTHYSQYADVSGTNATVSVATPGSAYTFVVAAYNASGSQSGYSSRVTATTWSTPTYTGPTSVGATANHPLSFALSASGNPATFTYSPLSMPEGMSVNSTTGLVSWTPPDGAVGTTSCSFSITNGVGTTTAVVSVQVAANLPNVTYTTSGPVVATQSFSAQFSQVSDPYNSSPVTYSLVSGPAGMTIDSGSGALSWLSSFADIGTSSATVRATNYAGIRDTSLTIPVYFAGAVQNVTASNTSTSGATISWTPPAVSASPIAGYHIKASYVVHSGRFNTTQTLNFSAPAEASSVAITGLPASKTISIAVTAYDAAGHDGLPGMTSFSTAYATPTIAVTGGPYIYDGISHGATATAYGINGVTPVAGSFTYTYNGLDTLPTEPGTYSVEATFTSADSYYADTVGTGTLTISPATPTVLIDGGPFTYDGAPHAATATAYGIDGATPIAGSFTFSYEGSSSPPVNPGIYAVTAAFTSNDPRYANTTATGTLTTTSVGSLAPVLQLSAGTHVYDGTPHAAILAAYQINGTTPLGGTFSVTYNGLPDPPVDAGNYTVVASFASRDAAYADAQIVGSLTIAPATPTLSLGGDLTYTGYAQDAIAMAYGIDGVTPVAGSLYFSYDGLATSPTDAGTYLVMATFVSADPNYADATISGSLTIAPAQPWVIATGGGFTFDGTTHEGTAAVYGVDGMTQIDGAVTLSYYGWDNDLGSFELLPSAPKYAGVYYVEAHFTSNDPNYADSTGTDYLYIDQAIPTLVVSGGPFAFDGTPHQATAVAYGVDGVTPINGFWSITYDGSPTPPTDPGTYAVLAQFTSTDPSGSYADTSISTSMTIGATILSRYLFYNQSHYDGQTSGVSPNDDQAIAIDKDALLPGQIATFANVSSYTKGINGIMLDIYGVHGAITAADFVFKLGNDNIPSNWAYAPAPSTVSVRTGAGVSGSDRVELIWANNAIQKSWLEVITLGNAHTGLAPNESLPGSEADIFFFGNAPADSGLGDTATQATVSASDVLGARNHPQSAFANIDVTNVFDFNRDGTVSSTDELAARNNTTSVANALRYLSLASPPAAPQTSVFVINAVTSALASPEADHLGWPEPGAKPDETRQSPVLTPGSRQASSSLADHGDKQAEDLTRSDENDEPCVELDEDLLGLLAADRPRRR